jgi:hypothetical protein
MEEYRIKGALNLRRGWKIYESLIKDLDTKEVELDPLIVANIKFGAGLFFWVISLVPAGIAQRAVSFIGFKANKDLGMKYLRECYASKSLRAYYAGILVALNNVQLSAALDSESNLENVRVRDNFLLKLILYRKPFLL